MPFELPGAPSSSAGPSSTAPAASGAPSASTGTPATAFAMTMSSDVTIDLADEEGESKRRCRID
eukprot:4137136-Amphidinium_carterae.1